MVSSAGINTGALLTSRKSVYSLTYGHDSDDSDGSTFCEPLTNTFIVAGPISPNPAVRQLLDGALGNIQDDINNSGFSGLIPERGWRQLGRNGVSMVVFSELQYRTTYGVLHSAIQALRRWMLSPGSTWGTCSFTIWDGPNRVGYGNINS